MKITYDEVVKVIEKADTQIDMKQLNENAVFTDIGADSLDIMSILLGLQELTSFEVPDEDIEKLGSIRSICEYFDGKS